MFVLSNCTEGRRNILCCRNQHWKGKSGNKSGTSKLQQPGRLRPKGWCIFGFSGNPGGWGQQEPVEKWGDQLRSIRPLVTLCTAPITLHQPLVYVQSFPGIPTMLCPVACSGVLLESCGPSPCSEPSLWPHTTCAYPSFSSGKRSQQHLCSRGWEGQREMWYRNTETQPHFSTTVFPKNEK